MCDEDQSADLLPPPDRAAQIELFHALANIAAENNLGEGVLVKIKFNIIASLYDYNPNLAAFMKVGAANGTVSIKPTTSAYLFSLEF